MRRKFKKYFLKPLFSAAVICCALLFSGIAYINYSLPDGYSVCEGSTLDIDTQLPISVEYNGTKQSDVGIVKSKATSYSAEINLLGVFPAKSVEVSLISKNLVALSGEPFGIKIYTDGVLVVGVDEVDTEHGNKSPAKEAGIKVGDYILTVEGEKVYSNEDVAKQIEESGGKEVRVLIKRDNKQISLKLKPQLSYSSGKFKAGVWVKDSGAGIGTLTFYSPATGVVCGLGHGICDGDTGRVLSLNSGELVTAEILGVVKGTAGTPGELKGRFKNIKVGDLLKNTDTGVYAKQVCETRTDNLVEIALKQEIKVGKAQVMVTVDSEGRAKLYNCEIKKIAYGDSITKNMVIKITDKELLEKTGGIVQGMSGSPIIQNGKLVGAVTHVFVDDPTEGYGIFAENMLETAQSVSENNKLKEAS